jgi:membrane-associated protease RseP (regulator of RpoE activity)
MLLAIIFAAFTLVFFYYIIPSFQQTSVYVVSTVPNSPANGILIPGSTILKWNGYSINNVSSFKVAAVADTPGANISVITNKGAYVLTANSTGKVGVEIAQNVVTTGGIEGEAATFLYSFFALSFLLNFLVAVVNYLPIPSFDGWRVFNLNIKNKKIVNALAIFVVICLIINVLPWIWQA